jgi:hypothetical protein
MEATEQLVVPGWWSALFERCPNASIFLSSAWLETWLAIYGSEFEKWWIHWRRGEVIVGGCLLLSRRVRVGGLVMKTLYLNATGQAGQLTPMAEFNDVLHCPGYTELIAADLARILESMSWSRLALSGYEPGGVLARSVELLPRAHIDCSARPAPYVDLRALPDVPFEKTVKGKSGTWIRRNRRIHNERFGTVLLTKPASLAEALDSFSELVELNRRRWAGAAVTTFAAPAVVDFHRGLIERLWASGAVDLLRVASEGRVVGFLYNFVLRNKVSVFQTGFNYGADSRLSPGLLAHSLAIEHYRASGEREYDFLAGDALYKRTLAKCQRELRWAVLYRDQGWVRVVLAARRLKHHLLGN